MVLLFRKSISLLLVSAFLLQTITQAVIVIHYEFNKDFISKNLCENKNKPMMHCNGKCHLAKQLKQADKESPKKDSQRVPVQDYTNLFFSRIASVTIIPFEESKQFGFSYSENYSFQYCNPLFRPPPVKLG